ncbi:hypothetical protein, partial [Escherichia albertii]
SGSLSSQIKHSPGNPGRFTFHMLTVVNMESQETWKWTERSGQHPLI